MIFRIYFYSTVSPFKVNDACVRCLSRRFSLLNMIPVLAFYCAALCACIPCTFERYTLFS